MLSRRPVIIRGPYASEQSVVDHSNGAMLSEVDVQVREAFRVADHVASSKPSESWNTSSNRRFNPQEAAYIHVQITETDHCNTKKIKKEK